MQCSEKARDVKTTVFVHHEGSKGWKKDNLFHEFVSRDHNLGEKPVFDSQKKQHLIVSKI